MRYRRPRPERVRYNPLGSNPELLGADAGDAGILYKWLNAGETPSLEAQRRIVAALEAHPVDSDAAIVEVVRDFFLTSRYKNRTAPARSLDPKELFNKLGTRGVGDNRVLGMDVFTSPMGPRPTDPRDLEALNTEAYTSLERQRSVLDAERYRQEVSRHGSLTGEESLYIQKQRHLSKERSRLVSVSGSLCRKYRNTTRLRAYSPPREVLETGTCWILIGPQGGASGAQSARVMSFRNGAHIDCDMVATRATPLHVIIAKAIEEVALWLAEKPVRVDGKKGIRAVWINQIGSNECRKLWPFKGSLTLNTARMLASAYEGDATDVPWLKLDRDGSKNLENYRRALQTAAPVRETAPMRADNYASEPEPEPSPEEQPEVVSGGTDEWVVPGAVPVAEDIQILEPASGLVRKPTRTRAGSPRQTKKGVLPAFTPVAEIDVEEQPQEQVSEKAEVPPVEPGLLEGLGQKIDAVMGTGRKPRRPRKKRSED